MTDLQVDAMWRDLMDAALASPGVLGLASTSERLDGLAENNRLLEDIQKVLMLLHCAVLW